MDLGVLLNKIVKDDVLHSKFLNTLSFMENAGARKISASEDVEKVSIIQLKHAAEEHRHAYYLKKQLLKLNVSNFLDYSSANLLAANSTKRFLHQLDIKVCKYLKANFALEGRDLKYAAYLFVTYAIEVRADELYPVYQDVLSQNKSKVMVKSIILEEEGHLEEMVAQLKEFSDDWLMHAAKIEETEHKLFEEWCKAMVEEVNLYAVSVR